MFCGSSRLESDSVYSLIINILYATLYNILLLYRIAHRVRGELIAIGFGGMATGQGRVTNVVRDFIVCGRE